MPVMDFKVRNLLDINMPLAIDFGTTNTTAGTYLDSGYMERLSGDPVRESLHENDVNYVTYLQGEEDGEETPILPSVVASQISRGTRYIMRSATARTGCSI